MRAACVIAFAAVSCLGMCAQYASEYIVLRKAERALTIRRVPLQSDLLQDDFKLASKVDGIPETLKHLLPQLVDEPRIELAEPGAGFQASDVIFDEKHLPWRRMDLAGASARACFLFYEHGGYAHSYLLVVVDPCSGPTANVAISIFPERCDTLECVRQALPKSRPCPEEGHCE